MHTSLHAVIAFFFCVMAIKVYSVTETTQIASHYDPMTNKRLTISSSCSEDDIILFRDLHLIAPHIAFTLASLSDSPLRSCSFYEKGGCTLIPSICVGSVDTATLSTFCPESTQAVTGYFSLQSPHIHPLLGAVKGNLC